MAVEGVRTWMSRNSMGGVIEGEMLVHVLPALVVRRTVAFTPATQAVFSERGERPRNWAFVLVGVIVQERFGGFGV